MELPVGKLGVKLSLTSPGHLEKEISMIADMQLKK